jgi:DNA-binding MarR family transcriptional regulator
LTAKAAKTTRTKDGEAAAGSVWALFLTAHALLVERIEARLAATGLPPLTWYDVLWALERSDGGRLRLSDLADHMVLSRSNMTRLVDRLVAARLVVRSRSDEDGRGMYAVITAAGKAQRAEMWPVYKAEISARFGAHLKPAEVRAMNAALSRIVSAATSLDDSG